VRLDTAKKTERGHQMCLRVTNTLVRDDHALSTEGQYSRSKRRAGDYTRERQRTRLGGTCLVEDDENAQIWTSRMVSI